MYTLYHGIYTSTYLFSYSLYLIFNNLIWRSYVLSNYKCFSTKNQNKLSLRRLVSWSHVGLAPLEGFQCYMAAEKWEFFLRVLRYSILLGMLRCLLNKQTNNKLSLLTIAFEIATCHNRFVRTKIQPINEERNKSFLFKNAFWKTCDSKKENFKREDDREKLGRLQ